MVSNNNHDDDVDDDDNDDDEDHQQDDAQARSDGSVFPRDSRGNQPHFSLTQVSSSSLSSLSSSGILQGITSLLKHIIVIGGNLASFSVFSSQ